MKIKLLLFLGFLCGAQTLFAQTDFRPGYVISLSGDTLKGEIDNRGDILMGEVCRFIPKGTNKEIKYSPFDIQSYQVIGNKYYVSKDFNNGKTFVEYLFKGKVNVFYMRDQLGEHFFIQKDTSRLIEIPYKEDLVFKDNLPHILKSTKHNGLLYYYMQDAPSLKQRILTMEKPKRENLIKLAEDYHNVVCKGELCYNYQKKLPFIKLSLELIGGGTYYKEKESGLDQGVFQGGMLAHFWLPRSNEKLYFRTGVIATSLMQYNEKTNVYKFPFQLEYIYPKGNIRPVAAYGINLYKNLYSSYYSVGFMGGTNVKLAKAISLGVLYDIDFFPLFSIVPQKFLSNGLSVSLKHSFK
jgi:hypothetical protein